MTFLQEEEVFPTVTGSDASEKLEDSSKLSASAECLKEEPNNTNVVTDGKRKLSDKPAEKKVLLFFPCCLYKWLHPAPFFFFVWTWK